MWTQNEILAHKRSCETLEKIFGEIPEYISNHKEISEYDLQQFIKKRFAFYNHISDKDEPIVAFGKNTSFVHYFPEKNSKILEKGDLILIDIRAREKQGHSPFSDITQMFYYGDKIPNEINKVFNDVIFVRDLCLKYIENNLKNRIIPTGHELNELCKKTMKELGYFDKMNHSLGHSIGFYSCHGIKRNLNKTNHNSLEKNLGYTIEPGIYLPESNFGIRSEMNFYIDDECNLIKTTKLQKEIRLIECIL